MHNTKRTIGFYIHIPFCKLKCFYCDFNSYTNFNEDEISDYFMALKKEIDLYSVVLKNYAIKTIFIGGGTPSLVNENHIAEVLSYCRNKFNIIDEAEITIETNPGTLNKSKLLKFKESGINRLSIGLQAWQNSLLKSIGRIHNNEEFYKNILDSKQIGFNNINVDLIFGIPGQTLDDWNETLDRVVELGVTHISAYSLKVEENTKFGDLFEKGKLTLIDDEIDREMYYKTIEKLGNNNLEQYEISNFSKKNFECKHNLIYWMAEEYIGLGAGAHSYFKSKRYNNPLNPGEYIKEIMKERLPCCNIEILDEKDKMSEYMFLGLRLIKGIIIKEFYYKFGKNIFDVYNSELQKLINKNLIFIENDYIKLTTNGLDFANEVFMEFV